MLQSSADLFFSVDLRDRSTLEVHHPRQLARIPDAVVPLGTAPDGLPLLMRVHRNVQIEDLILRRLGPRSRRTESPEIQRALEALRGALREFATQSGIEGEEGQRVYRTAAGVPSLLGQTLMVRLLGASSPLHLEQERPYRYGAAQDIGRVAFTCAAPHTPDFDRVLEDLSKRLHLLLPLSGAAPLVAKQGGGGRPARFESLLAFPSACFRTHPDQRLHPIGSKPYALAVCGAAQLAWSVELQDVGAALIRLSRELATMHRAGRVHCDIKPANVLITKDKVLPFDSLDVPAGQRSPGATPGWAAPEQILARPVCAQTDVFALGLMVARLLGAVIYGEERAFLIPTGGVQRRRVHLLAEPAVFIDPRADLPAVHRLARERFIARCVAFDPCQRPDAARFADDLEGLLEEQPLIGRCAISCGPGMLRGSVLHGERSGPAWVVSDAMHD